MKIAFIQTHMPRPRNIRQASSLSGIADVSLVAINREQAFKTEIQPGVYDSVLVKNFDLVESKHFLKRLVSSLGVERYFLDSLSEIKPDCVQAEGLDSLFFAVRYARKANCAVVYQVSDVREALLPQKTLGGKIKGGLIGAIEAHLLQNISLLVLTSEKFYQSRYKKFVDRNATLIWHNIPDLSIFDNFSKKSHAGYRVGFVGSVRYQQQLRMLVDAVGCFDDVQAVFAGAGKKFEYENLKEYCAGKEWTTLTGAYDYATEICGIYSELDCIYAVYDAMNENVKIALPNKLYEAICCELPLIVAKGTYLAELVEEWGVGLAVSCTDVSELVDAIAILKSDKNLNEDIRRNCRKKKEELIRENPRVRYREVAGFASGESV